MELAILFGQTIVGAVRFDTRMRESGDLGKRRADMLSQLQLPRIIRFTAGKERKMKLQMPINPRRLGDAAKHPGKPQRLALVERRDQHLIAGPQL